MENHSQIPWSILNNLLKMYKYLVSFEIHIFLILLVQFYWVLVGYFQLVLVALAACVFAAQDQEAAEQYFLRYGSYPSWYCILYHYFIFKLFIYLFIYF